jgi:threonine dehydrogenase-like Zn-dependent dehydrogenase
VDNAGVEPDDTVIVLGCDIITHRIPLKDAQHAYEIFDEKLDDCIKVVLKP